MIVDMPRAWLLVQCFQCLLLTKDNTGVVVLLYVGVGGRTVLLSANVGDSRAVLLRGSQAIQLSDDHVPDQCAVCNII